MIAKPVADLTIDDIRALVTDEVAEGRRLEFKQQLPGGTDSDKKEFLYDISSLANAAGGDLVFGVADIDGIASGVPGLESFNEDKDILRLESCVRDGVESRIPGIKWHKVDGGDKGPVLVARVPRSWTGPHMVTFKSASRFYTRGSKGKFQMDVAEIGDAFKNAAGITSRIEQWRTERLGRVASNSGPIKHQDEGCLVVHLIPLESMTDRWRFDVNELQSQFGQVPPMNPSGWSHQFNLDGYLTFTQADNSRQLAFSYRQAFRSGAIEMLSSDALEEREGNNFVSCAWCEKTIIDAMKPNLAAIAALGLQPPILCLVSMTGVGGSCLYVEPRRSRGYSATPLDRDVLTFPEVVIEDLDCDLPAVLRPVFDAMWNAYGVPCSYSYDSEGNWNPS